MPKFLNSLSRILLFMLFHLSYVQAQSFGISDRAEISLITGSPGQDLYTLFGHSAIRVHDPATGYDILYNYGTFDFRTPNFYAKFAQRRLDYFLSISDYNRFVSFYSKNNRSIYEQKLNLNPEQTKAIYKFLQKNYLPENRFYLYDFFYDNCSSRIRDVFQEVLEGDIQFNFPENPPRKTYRNLIDPYQHNPWIQLGLYLLLGAPTDKVASPYDYMFLPDYLMASFDDAKIKQSGKFEALVSEKKDVVIKVISKPKSGFFNPYVVFWGFFICMGMLNVLEYRRRAHFKIIDFFLFSILGLVGTFFLMLWLGTDHEQVSWNFNILWALPTHAIFALLIWKKTKPDYLKKYFRITAIILALMLVIWWLLPQQLHPALIPLFLVIIMRSLKIGF